MNDVHLGQRSSKGVGGVGRRPDSGNGEAEDCADCSPQPMGTFAPAVPFQASQNVEDFRSRNFSDGTIGEWGRQVEE